MTDMKALCGEPGCDCGYTIEKLLEALEKAAGALDYVINTPTTGYERELARKTTVKARVAIKQAKERA